MADKTTKEQSTWCGRPVLSEHDCNELETAAAINEFHKKMPRPVAEETAYNTYMRNKRLEASAHHLLGMKAAHAAGKMDEARKHGKMYELHMKAAGLSHTGPVPEEVSQMIKDKGSSGVYKFKAHKADSFASEHAPESQPVSKGLTERFFTLYAAAKQFLDLRKGDVVQFKPKTSPKASAPSSDPTPKTVVPSKQPAPVASLSPHIERNKFMDEAKSRAGQSEPELTGKATGEKGTHHQTYDYSHFLEDSQRFQGYKLMVLHHKDHDGFKPKQGTDAIVARLYHNGEHVASALGHASIRKLPSPTWVSGQEKHGGTSREMSAMAAVRAHGDWAGYHRASDHAKGVRDLFHDEND